jgi:hypothetical protein
MLKYATRIPCIFSKGEAKMNIWDSSRWWLLFCLAGLILFGTHGELKSQDFHRSGEKILREKVSECPFVQEIFKEESRWLFSEDEEWLYANLARGTKTFVFGYQKPKKKEWGEYLPRWYFTVGSMELGMVIATFKGAVKERRYLINSISTISKNCPFPDIQASLNHEEVVEQISVDANCDHFFDKVYGVKIRSEHDYHQQEPYAQEARIIIDTMTRLKTGNW